MTSVDHPEGQRTPRSFGPDDTPYDALGGDERVRALVDTFYDRMDADEAYAGIRALHPADLATSRTKLYEFLSGWLGGPPLYIERYGHPRLRGRHMPFPIGDAERDQWLACMSAALDACGVEADLRGFLDARFAHVANFMRNRE
jgi:hemoglobin